MHAIIYPTGLYADPWPTEKVKPILTVPPDAKVIVDGHDGVWAHVRFVTKSNKEYMGWLEEKLAEEVRTDGNILDFSPYQTPTFQDSEQYLVMLKRVIHNVCGVASLARVFGFDALQPMLDIMQANAPAYYQTIVSDKGLGIMALEKIAAAGGMETSRVVDLLRDNGRFLLSPRRVQWLLDDGWKIVIGIRINYAGYLDPAGTIAHWGTLERLEPFGINNAKGTWFNSYNNALEPFDWRVELIPASKRWNSFSWLALRMKV
jgi:hypothetical protein